LKVYLRLYDRSLSPSWLKNGLKIFTTWNHCSVGIENSVVHFYDDYKYPKITTEEADNKLKSFVFSFYVGTTDKSLEEIEKFFRTINYMTWKDHLSRYISPFLFYKFPKKENDCVNNCSKLLNFLVGTPIVYTTPDKLYGIIKQNSSR
jgi:hypothetical protein